MIVENVSKVTLKLEIPGTSLKEVEKLVLKTALQANKNIAKLAARDLGITPRVMSYKMKKHGLPANSWQETRMIAST